MRRARRFPGDDIGTAVSQPLQSIGLSRRDGAPGYAPLRRTSDLPDPLPRFHHQQQVLREVLLQGPRRLPRPRRGTHRRSASPCRGILKFVCSPREDSPARERAGKPARRSRRDARASPASADDELDPNVDSSSLPNPRFRSRRARLPRSPPRRRPSPSALPVAPRCESNLPGTRDNTPRHHRPRPARGPPRGNPPYRHTRRPARATRAPATPRSRPATPPGAPPLGSASRATTRANRSGEGRTEPPRGDGRRADSYFERTRRFATPRGSASRYPRASRRARRRSRARMRSGFASAMIVDVFFARQVDASLTLFVSPFRRHR